MEATTSSERVGRAKRNTTRLLVYAIDLVPLKASPSKSNRKADISAGVAYRLSCLLLFCVGLAFLFVDA